MGRTARRTRENLKEENLTGGRYPRGKHLLKKLGRKVTPPEGIV